MDGEGAAAEKVLEVQYHPHTIFVCTNTPIALWAIGLDTFLIENIHTFVHFVISDDEQGDTYNRASEGTIHPRHRIREIASSYCYTKKASYFHA